jgi:hypothetical protein
MIMVFTSSFSFFGKQHHQRLVMGFVNHFPSKNARLVKNNNSKWLTSCRPSCNDGWKRTTAFATTTNRLYSTSVDSLDELNQKIKAKGDEIRQLKADGMDKESLAPHVEELLTLKAQLPPLQVEENTSKQEEEKNANPKRNTPANNTNNKKQQQQPEKELTESEIKLNRLAKVNAMREAKVEPFEYSYDVTTSSEQLAADYEGKLNPGEEDEDSDVAVAGRIMTRRVFGKLAFFSLQDESGIIQLQFDKKRLGDSFKVRR